MAFHRFENDLLVPNCQHKFKGKSVWWYPFLCTSTLDLPRLLAHLLLPDSDTAPYEASGQQEWTFTSLAPYEAPKESWNLVTNHVCFQQLNKHIAAGSTHRLADPLKWQCAKNVDTGCDGLQAGKRRKKILASLLRQLEVAAQFVQAEVNWAINACGPRPCSRASWNSPNGRRRSRLTRISSAEQRNERNYSVIRSVE